MDTEIWYTISSKGTRMAWTFSTSVGRSIRLPIAEADLGVMEGRYEIIDQPWWKN